MIVRREPSKDSAEYHLGYEDGYFGKPLVNPHPTPDIKHSAFALGYTDGQNDRYEVEKLDRNPGIDI